MYFKRLELFGFKSFAEKTVFEFEPGVTAIVGPNGCGKSNVVDAMKWVLGEENPREVRAPRLEDVIFNGTEHQPPLGFAEVSLTLSNESKLLPVPYEEVTITRRAFRSGESEYFINKTSCRLKDIAELLMGTGLGASAYSIMAQGQMDLVLSQRPEDRRQVFEEASGITKYKAKKREALRKLDETEQNLLRVVDIIAEVKRQLTSIERHAAKARRYREQFEQLKALETQLAVQEHRRLVIQREALSAQLAALEAQQVQWQERHAQLVASVQQVRSAMEETARLQAEAQTQLVTVTSTLERHQGEIALKERWRQELVTQREQLTQESQRLREKRTQLAAQEQQLTAAVAHHQQWRAAQEQAVRATTERLASLDCDMTAASTGMRQAKERLLELSAHVARHRNDVAKQQATLSSQSARLTRLQAEGAQVQQETARAEQRLTASRAEQGRLQQELTRAQQQQTHAEDALRETDRALQELAALLQTLHGQVSERESRVAFLDGLEQTYEGFSEGVRAVMRQQVSGVIGPVAQVITPARGAEPAVEAALGDLLQAVVVEDRQAAWRCIAWLRQQRAGRVSFLPLDVLRDRVASSSTPPPSITGLLGALSAQVHVDARCAPLAQALLDGVWFVEEFDPHATMPKTGRFVSRQGLRWDGLTLSGGAGGNDDLALVGRRQRTDAARHALAEARQTLAAAEERRLQTDQQRQSLLAQLESLRQQREQWQNDLSRQETTVAHITAERKRLDDEHAVLELEIGEMQESVNASQTQLTQLTATLTQTEATLRQTETQIAQTQETLTQSAKQREALMVEQAQAHSGLATADEKAQTLALSLSQTQADARETAQAIEAKAQQVAQTHSRDRDLSAQIAEHQTAMTQWQGERAQAEQRSAAIDAQLQTLRTQLGQLEPQLSEEASRRETLNQQMHQLQQQEAQVGFAQQSLVDRLRDVYQVELAETLAAAAQSAASSPVDLEAMHREIETLKKHVTAMGAVSLGSIEEYEELKHRHAFLTAQHDDLLKAQGSLKEAIAKINRTTRELFIETFQQIREEFRVFYKLLFSGGEAELFLSDESDVLESGIEIVARPPGKKLQSITLLSGGEKALTAIALLFALFKVKPSPFCVLDEIDAPLDEANIDRFTRALGEFLKLSQFIIVTHNKKTITRADVMYGITMEEPGSSKIVSVKFASSSDGAGQNAGTPSVVTNGDPVTDATPA